MTLSRYAGVAIIALLAGAAFAGLAQSAVGQPQAARFLYAWTGDADSADSDFLAVIDVTEGSPTYAQVVRTIPVGANRLAPHHTEQMLSGKQFFANGFTHRTLIWDAEDPLAPRVVGELEHAHGLHHAHSFVRISDGTVLATHQFGDGSRAGNPGGLVLFDPDGKVVRTASSFDPAYPGAPIRTYSLDVSELADRVLTVSSPMDNERTADVFQLWRLSDLALLSTVRFAPEADSSEAYPFEVRFLPGGRNALLSTYYCGFYLLSDLHTAAPKARLVHRFATDRGNRACGVPLLLGNYWLMPIAYGGAVVVVDVSDPEHPREVSRLQTDSGVNPHWLSADPGSNRIVLVDQGDGDTRIFLLRFNAETGALTLDDGFRDPGASRPGVTFARDRWPHGATGPGIPHGTFFVP